jgi:hypothetical protein
MGGGTAMVTGVCISAADDLQQLLYQDGFDVGCVRWRLWVLVGTSLSVLLQS